MQSNPNYKYPNNREIEEFKSLLDIPYRIPHLLIQDMLTLASYRISGLDATQIISQSFRSKEIKEFYTQLPWGNFMGSTPLELAFDVISFLSRHYSLAALVEGQVTEIDNLYENVIQEGEFDEQDLDFVREISENSEEQIARILSMMNNWPHSLLLQSTKNDDITLQRLSHYGQVAKTRKKDIIDPLFQKKLLEKTLFIEDCTVDPEEKVLLFLEDISSSMNQPARREISSALKLKLINHDSPIVYAQFYGLYLQVIGKYTTKEEKIQGFLQPIYYQDLRTYYRYIFEQIQDLNLDEMSDVIIYTDGEDDVGTPQVRHTYHFITLQQNNSIRNLIHRTGGSHLII